MQATPKPLKTVDYIGVAKFSGGFAALFILMQILGMMFEIFSLQQRVIDSSTKNTILVMIAIYVVKNIYAMCVVGSLFIMT